MGVGNEDDQSSLSHDNNNPIFYAIRVVCSWPFTND